MLKLCVICHTIGKPFDKKFSFDEKMTQVAYSWPYWEKHLRNLCPKCENRNCMIPIDTPRAQRIIKEDNLEIKEYVRKEYEEKFVWDKDYEPPDDTPPEI